MSYYHRTPRIFSPEELVFLLSPAGHHSSQYHGHVNDSLNHHRQYNQQSVMSDVSNFVGGYDGRRVVNSPVSWSSQVLNVTNCVTQMIYHVPQGSKSEIHIQPQRVSSNLYHISPPQKLQRTEQGGYFLDPIPRTKFDHGHSPYHIDSHHRSRSRASVSSSHKEKDRSRRRSRSKSISRDISHSATNLLEKLTLSPKHKSKGSSSHSSVSSRSTRSYGVYPLLDLFII